MSLEGHSMVLWVSNYSDTIVIFTVRFLHSYDECMLNYNAAMIVIM